MLTRWQKNFIAIGTVSGAIVSIWTAVAMVRPVLASDNPPFANVDRVSKEDKQYLQLAADVQSIKRHVDSSDLTQAFLAQGFYQNQKIDAENALRKNPGDKSAQLVRQNAVTQLNHIGGYLATHQPHF